MSNAARPDHTAHRPSVDSDAARGRTLVLRADASAHIGSGHVMRCLALAQAWQDAGGRAIFASRQLPESLQRRLDAESMHLVAMPYVSSPLEDAHATAHIASRWQADWVVLDGYSFPGNCQSTLSQHAQLMVIDDHAHADYYDCHLLLNQNLGVERRLYAAGSRVDRWLLGTTFCLIRREFHQRRRRQRQHFEQPRRLLITLGGSDPDNATQKVLDGLLNLTAHRSLQVVVLVGGTNPNAGRLERHPLVTSQRGQLVRNATDICRWMQWADIAVSAGGSTCWELAMFGVPHLIMVLADNQRGIAEAIDAGSRHVNLGWHADCSAEDVAHHLSQLISDPQLRQQLSNAGQARVDGWGSQRVIEQMLHQQLSRRRAAS